MRVLCNGWYVKSYVIGGMLLGFYVMDVMW